MTRSRPSPAAPLAALGRRLPARAIRIGAAALFFVFGAWLAVEAFVTH